MRLVSYFALKVSWRSKVILTLFLDHSLYNLDCFFINVLLWYNVRCSIKGKNILIKICWNIMYVTYYFRWKVINANNALRKGFVQISLWYSWGNGRSDMFIFCDNMTTYLLSQSFKVNKSCVHLFIKYYSQ